MRPRQGQPFFLGVGLRKVRKTPRWPRSWASISLSSPYSHMNARASLQILGRPDAVLARKPHLDWRVPAEHLASYPLAGVRLATRPTLPPVNPSAPKHTVSEYTITLGTVWSSLRGRRRSRCTTWRAHLASMRSGMPSPGR
jgi:hypothetical protein